MVIAFCIAIGQVIIDSRGQGQGQSNVCLQIIFDVWYKKYSDEEIAILESLWKFYSAEVLLILSRNIQLRAKTQSTCVENTLHQSSG